ncbi:MAG: fibronectin type III domain-containing protein [Acidimicrobiales bacterium]
MRSLRPMAATAVLAASSFAGLLVASSASAQAAGTPNQAIRTIAGSTGSGPATSVAQSAATEGSAVFGPYLYLSDPQGCVIRRMSISGATETVVAGNGYCGYSGDGGPAKSASLMPEGITVDRYGNVLIADATNHLRVLAEGKNPGYVVGDCPQTAVASDGSTTASSTSVSSPTLFGTANAYVGWTITDSRGSIPYGTLITADAGGGGATLSAAANYTETGDTFTLTTEACSSWTDGDIYNLAGNGSSYGSYGVQALQGVVYAPATVAFDVAHNIVIGSSSGYDVVIAQSASNPGYPLTGCSGSCTWTVGDTYAVNGAYGLPVQAVDSHLNLVYPLQSSSAVKVFALTTGTYYGQSMTAGSQYTVAGGTAGFDAGEGGPATSATLWYPQTVKFDSAGNILIGDDDPRVSVVAESASNPGYPLSGCSGTCTWTVGDIYSVFAPHSFVEGLALDKAGDVVADTYSAVDVLARSTATSYGIAMTSGDQYVVAGNGYVQYSGDGGKAGSAQMGRPTTVAYDAAGNVLFGDPVNGRIRVVANSASNPGYPLSGCPHVPASASDGSTTFNSTTVSSATLFATANQYDGWSITDAYGSIPAGDTIVSEAGGGSATLAVAAKFTESSDQFNLTYSACSGWTKGDIYTIAGGGIASPLGGSAASTANISPSSLLVDKSGNVLFGENTTSYPAEGMIEVEAVSASNPGYLLSGCPSTCTWTPGDLYTVAGGANGNPGSNAGNGGPATSASLNPIDGMALDAAGNVVATESCAYESYQPASYCYSAVRLVALSSGTDDGIATTAGDIYTLAGGTPGFAGDGGPDSGAEFSNLRGVTVDKVGDIVVADGSNFRVRLLAEYTGVRYGIATTKGDVYTVAGDGLYMYGSVPTGAGGQATSAEIYPESVALTKSGLVLVADNAGRVLALPGTSGTNYGVSMSQGDIYDLVGTGTAGYSGDGNLSVSAQLGPTLGLAVSPTNAVVIADAMSSRIRQLYTVTAPGGPSALSVQPGDTTALVTWHAPSSTGGTPIVSYTVESSGGQVAVVSGSSLSAVVTGLTDGTSYTFTVTANNELLAGAASTSSSPVTPDPSSSLPGAPTMDSAVSVQPATATVTWSAPTGTVTGYAVTASPGGVTVMVPASSTSATITGLTHGDSYSFTVTAVNANGPGAPSGSSGSVAV